MSYTFTPGIDPEAQTALDRVTSYDADKIERVLRGQIEKLGLADMFRNKRVAIKPNLVMKKSPDAAATTHPAVLEAMIRILKDSAAGIVIVESPPGLYTESALKGFYNACGITPVAEKYGLRLNTDMTSREVSLPDGVTAKGFELISPMLDADVIVDLAKLKSHALTKFSGAVKNYYGTIPGLQKVETHARFPDYGDFGSMLCDLCAYFAGNKPTFSVLDGIVAMEGNGPTGGEPKELGVLISGINPFSVDTVGAHIAGIDGVIMLDEAKRRSFTKDAPELHVISDKPLDTYVSTDFVMPESVEKSGSSIHLLTTLCGGRIYKFIQPHPEIEKNKCVGCGACARSCPKQTIEFRNQRGGGRYARINRSGCIECYCCQELCPVKAVKIKKNPLFSLLNVR